MSLSGLPWNRLEELARSLAPSEDLCAVEVVHAPPPTAPPEELAAWDERLAEIQADAAADARIFDPSAPVVVTIVRLTRDVVDVPRPALAADVPLPDVDATHTAAPGTTQSVSEGDWTPSAPSVAQEPPPTDHLSVLEHEPATFKVPFHICNWHPADGWCQVEGCRRRAGSFRRRELETDRGIPAADIFPGLAMPGLPGERPKGNP